MKACRSSGFIRQYLPILTAFRRFSLMWFRTSFSRICRVAATCATVSSGSVMISPQIRPSGESETNSLTRRSRPLHTVSI